MKKSIKFLFLATIVTVAAISVFAIAGTAQAQTSTTPVACPVGFISTPITPIPVSNCYMFSTNLGLGSTGADVVALQTWLISNGYNIPAIASGQQAKGYFGIQTQSALMRYQMANGLNVSGVGYDKELGFFGPLTRAKVNSSCTTTSTGGIVASLDPSSPQTSTVQISSTSITPNIPLAVFDLKSQGAPSTLQSLKVGMPTMSPNLKGSQPGTLFTNIFIKAGGQSYAETSMVGDTITFSNISIPLPADVSVPIAVYVSVAQNTNNFYDGSNVSVNLPLNGIVALDSNYNNVPVNQGPIVGLLSGSTITFTSNSVQVSNTSAVLGTGITETINGPIIAYPVSFNFTLTADNNPIYLGTVPAHTNALIFSGKEGAIIPNIQILSVLNPLPGDSSDALIVPAGTSRKFTYQGMITNSGVSGMHSYRTQIIGIQYGTSPNNLTANTITSGLENLVVSYFLAGGGTATTTPSITVVSPNGGEVVNFQKGDGMLPIRWTSSGASSITPVSIYLTDAQGQKGVPIVQGMYNSGYYSWYGGSMNLMTGQYRIQVSFDKGATYVFDLSDASFTIIANSSTSNQPPVISGVTAPTTLNVNQTGTWSVNASDPENGSLSYGVDWGDSGCPKGYTCVTSAAATPSFVQTSTFTHSYSTAGIYTVTFTVRDNAGLTAQTSSTVQIVGAVVACPVGYICTPPGVTTVCPAGYTCNTVSVTNCPSGYTCSTMNPVVTTAQPTISLTITPNTLTQGQSTTVSWSTTGATRCSSQPPTGSYPPILPASWLTPATSGSFSFMYPNPITFTLYLSCTGPGGTTSTSLPIRVNAVQTQTTAVQSTTATTQQSVQSATINSNATTNYAHSVSASAGVGGYISPVGAIPVGYGANQTFTITPYSGYRLSSVMVDGVSTNAVSPLVLSNVVSNHTITATFTMIDAQNPTITTFTLTPTPVVRGQSATLSWTTTGGIQSCTIDTMGNYIFDSYLGTVYGPSGSVTATVPTVIGRNVAGISIPVSVELGCYTGPNLTGTYVPKTISFNIPPPTSATSLAPTVNAAAAVLEAVKAYWASIGR